MYTRDKRKETTRDCRGRNQRSPSGRVVPGRNERPGTHCSLIQQEERQFLEKSVPARSAREIEVKEKMEERRGW